MKMLLSLPQTLYPALRGRLSPWLLDRYVHRALGCRSPGASGESVHFNEEVVIRIVVHVLRKTPEVDA